MTTTYGITHDIVHDGTITGSLLVTLMGEIKIPIEGTGIPQEVPMVKITPTVMEYLNKIAHRKTM
jgi:hypothetical protein